jgi:hypothetical protein
MNGLVQPVRLPFSQVAPNGLDCVLAPEVDICGLETHGVEQPLLISLLRQGGQFDEGTMRR